jgi:hypothetical protein
MAEPHYPLGLTPTGWGGTVALPGNAGAVDDHFFRRYRSLLDAEDAAFDELEHAYEDGDRETFESDLAMWHIAIERRSSFLSTHGLAADVVSL